MIGYFEVRLSTGGEVEGRYGYTGESERVLTTWAEPPKGTGAEIPLPASGVPTFSEDGTHVIFAEMPSTGTLRVVVLDVHGSRRTDAVLDLREPDVGCGWRGVWDIYTQNGMIAVGLAIASCRQRPHYTRLEFLDLDGRRHGSALIEWPPDPYYRRERRAVYFPGNGKYQRVEHVVGESPQVLEVYEGDIAELQMP